MAGCVGGCHAEDEAESGVVGAREVVGYEAAGSVGFGEKAEAEGTGDVGEEEEEDEVAASLRAAGGEVVVQVDAGEDGDGDDDT